ncbi:NAD(P)-dependent oxidoreductase [Dyella sp.]|uniref:NAD-dependent epimerase/dehydratase family protein n=1 Tax=Dyella sp. TaxID=1869338 RepID=UPI003216DEA3
MKFTVIGAGGFVGGALVEALRSNGAVVDAPARGQELTGTAMGHVIFAAGVTADFRTRPFDAVEANTALPSAMLRDGRFDSFLYLSSARIYRNASDGTESADITVNPNDPEQLYDLTKLAGEAVCLASGRPGVRVARLSNVVGNNFNANTFIGQIIKDACTKGHVALRSSLDSSKDYVLLEDVVALLPRIAVAGTSFCYNVASGVNLTHQAVLAEVLRASGAGSSVLESAPLSISTPVDIARIAAEFSFKPSPVLPAIGGLVNEYRKTMAC